MQNWRWTGCWRRQIAGGWMVMMLALMPLCGGCGLGRSSGLTASVSAGPLGNAVLVTLPAGTRLLLPDEAAARVVQAALVNEAVREDPPEGGPDPMPRFRLQQSLKLATPAYIVERDAAEMDWVRRVRELEAVPRAK